MRKMISRIALGFALTCGLLLLTAPPARSGPCGSQEDGTWDSGGMICLGSPSNCTNITVCPDK